MPPQTGYLGYNVGKATCPLPPSPPLPPRAKESSTWRGPDINHNIAQVTTPLVDAAKGPRSCADVW